MEFELKVQAPQNAPVVWNYEQLKADITTALADYQNRVYTEDTIAEAKEDSAKLNKLKKAISDERISRKKEYMKPFETFEDQAKELCELIDEASSGIKSQVDAFEQKRIDEKTARIEALFADIISNYDLPFMTLEKIFNDKWYNKGTSEKAIAKEITERCEKAVSDLAIIKRMPSYAFEAEAVYKETLDLNKALAEGERMAQIQEQKKQAAQAKIHTDFGNSEDHTVNIETFEVAFKCRITKAQATALAQFCKENGIVLQKI